MDQHPDLWTGRRAAYLRGILVTYQVLPERDELAARIERHLTRTVKRHPEHALLLSPYVRWSLLPRARRADPRPAGRRHRIRWAYTRINTYTRLKFPL
ncbi:hypothetical protein OG609_44300 [Streptomyces sp. NBC_01224]|uniref:hypothetical protein n=1 Tax=Streptomyces sp. NBC_01224 TaxID=2903783 RepID=UPI002E0E906F|nr:hypothetical protein OG609_44300 [Streptomyces sp. NBC_01224]